MQEFEVDETGETFLKSFKAIAKHKQKVAAVIRLFPG
jgi:hypothetical protein